jgi:hypothetical protein
LFKNLLVQEKYFQDTYYDWVIWVTKEEKRLNNKLRPFVEVEIDFYECQNWCNQYYEKYGFSEICQYTNALFDKIIKEIMAKAVIKSECKIIVPQYIYLISEEIGQDKKNDFSSIYFISEFPGFERNEIIVDNERLFFEYAIALAAAYAVKLKTNIVMYDRKQRYMWA